MRTLTLLAVTAGAVSGQPHEVGLTPGRIAHHTLGAWRRPEPRLGRRASGELRLPIAAAAPCCRFGRSPPARQRTTRGALSGHDGNARRGYSVHLFTAEPSCSAAEAIFRSVDGLVDVSRYWISTPVRPGSTRQSTGAASTTLCSVVDLSSLPGAVNGDDARVAIATSVARRCRASPARHMDGIVEFCRRGGSQLEQLLVIPCTRYREVLKLFCRDSGSNV